VLEHWARGAVFTYRFTAEATGRDQKLMLI